MVVLGLGAVVPGRLELLSVLVVSVRVGSASGSPESKAVSRCKNLIKKRSNLRPRRVRMVSLYV